MNENKGWVLAYLSVGKGLISYEKCYEYLDAIPERHNFLAKTEFYSSPKNEMILDEEYKQMKRSKNLLCLRKLSNLNNLYSFQAQSYSERFSKIESRKRWKKSPTICGSVCQQICWAAVSIDISLKCSFCSQHRSNLWRCSTECLLVDSVASILAGRLTRKFFFQKKLNLIYKIRNPETNIYKYKRFVSKIIKSRWE